MTLSPRDTTIDELHDESDDVGRWVSEVHVAAAGQDGVCDVPGSAALPNTFDLANDGWTDDAGAVAVLSAGSEASVALGRFEAGGVPVDMAGEVVDIEMDYELADGTTGSDSYAADVSAATHSAETKGVSDVTASSATVQGELTELDGDDEASVYFEWGERGDGLPDETAHRTLEATGVVEETLEGLEEDVEYEYRFVAEVDGDVVAGDTASFGTADDPPSASVDGVSYVTSSGATLLGELDHVGGAESVEVFFEWRPSGTDDWNATDERTRTSTGPYSEEVSGLSADTEYEVRAAVSASDGDETASAPLTFTTPPAESAPAVDSYTLSATWKRNPHAEFGAEWTVSDADGNLDRVDIRVFDEGEQIDSVSTAVSGSEASGSREFKVKFASGNTYDVVLTVRDAYGRIATVSRTVTA
jgi:hypothetical protein